MAARRRGVYLAGVDYAFWGLVALALVIVILPRLLGRKHRVGGADARRKVDEGALLLDVRTPAEFENGHLPGATNIPVGELGRRVEELPKDRPIIAYCQSGMRSASAVRALRAKGVEAYNLGPMSAWG